MSVVIAMMTADGVVIASDRRARYGDAIDGDHYEKWVRSARWSIGVSGSLEIIPEISRVVHDQKDAYAVCEEIRDMLRGRVGWQPERPASSPSGMPGWDLQLLITDGAGIWKCCGSLFPMPVKPQVHHGLSLCFDAIGSGTPEALGALHAMLDFGSARDRVHKAVEIACRLDSLCGGDPYVDEIPRR